MANNPKFTNVEANAAADAISALLNSGYIRIYDGTQPADADTAISTQVLLATLRFGATAFGAAVAGVATANAIASGTVVAAGTAAWFRAFKSDGTTAVYDGSVGAAGADMNFTGGVVWPLGATIGLASGTYTRPKG